MKMLQNNLNLTNGNGSAASQEQLDPKPIYALEHLATFKIRHENEISEPKERLKTLFALHKNGDIWPMKMFMCFSGQWLIMLDNRMKEIENFPGSLIKQPVAFISNDPMELFNNILVFTVPGVSLGGTEMHFFQVLQVSAISLVEDLIMLSKGQTITVNHNKNPLRIFTNDVTNQNQSENCATVVEKVNQRNTWDEKEIAKDILLLNHCFEDIERFVIRLQYVAESLKQLELRNGDDQTYPNDGLLAARSRPPNQNEFQDILAKHKLAFNYVTKLQNHFQNSTESIHHLFTSLRTIVNVCNDLYVNKQIPEQVIDPLMKRDTIIYLKAKVNDKELKFWHSLGLNWTQAKEHFKDHLGQFKPVFYDEWSPDWVVDEIVPYIPLARNSIKPTQDVRIAWLTDLQAQNVKIAEVLYNKLANNSKELNVTRGEYLEVMHNSRNWWKCRNSLGNVGYVPYTILTAYNFECAPHHLARDNESLCSTLGGYEPEHTNHLNNNPMLSVYIEGDNDEHSNRRNSMSRSISMPNVPIPPPMPTNSDNSTPANTIERNILRKAPSVKPRNDDAENDVVLLKNSIHDELKLTLLQRERRKDMEILVTPDIYINQSSTPKQVEEWLKAKAFSKIIINKLRGLNGQELFNLSPPVLENYFGYKDSKRLISQIVLQKNICEYKTIRSSELTAKLAKARQKVDENVNNINEVF